MGHGFIDKGKNTSFVSKKEIAWHGLGKVVDSMTSEEAIKLGGLDYEVQLAQLKASVISSKGTPNEKKVEGNYATYRTDTLDIFGVVGSRYEVLQNTECFAFFDNIIGEGHARYETAGALGNGETVFLTAKLPKDLVINKDKVDQYLLLTNSHDGTSAVQIIYTPIRVVCNNTLRMAIGKSNNKFSIRHTKNVHDSLKKVHTAMGIIDRNSLRMKEIMENMAKVQIKDENAAGIISYAFGMSPDENKELSTRSKNKLYHILNSYYTGIGQSADIIGNGYGLFNGITTYLQNERKEKSDDALFKKSFLGSDDVIRNRAVKSILSYA